MYLMVLIWFISRSILSGLLDDISDLMIENSVIRWKPPFSLDLSEVEIDIIYCVDIYNITCDAKELAVSDCNVTSANYNSNAIVPDGYFYEFIITPRSNVEGAVNGTPSQPFIGTIHNFNIVCCTFFPSNLT